MTPPIRLMLADVDGTLVTRQYHPHRASQRGASLAMMFGEFGD